jgi:phosphomannomutase
MDSRRTGPELRAALIKGLTEAGAEVGDASLASTPAMFMSTILPDYAYDGAIMLTASHLPSDWNGMKFFTNEGGLEERDTAELLERAEQGQRASSRKHGRVQAISLLEDYALHLVTKIRREISDDQDYDRPLQELKIVVDAGNGAGGFFVSRVLQPLGADTTGSLFLDPDGTFPNHVPDPEQTAALGAIRKSVIDHGAALGIVFDTDVDRACAIAHDGEIVNKNRLIALVSALVLEEHSGSTIVTDSITSDGLHQFIEQDLGGRHHRFRRGYKNVINEAQRLNAQGQETHLAIETSGHAAFKENHFLDDGAYLIAKLLIKLAQMRRDGLGKLTALIAGLQEAKDSKDFRLKITSKAYKALSRAIIQDLREFVATIDGWSIVAPNYEEGGERVSCAERAGHGWFMLRLSLNLPELALSVESHQDSGVRAILKILNTFFANYPEVNWDAK